MILIATIVSAATFNKGDVVEVYNTGTAGLLVRGPNACDAQIGKKYDGNRGIILEGSFYCDNYNRWKIRWSDGLEGWSAENWLRKVFITPSTKFSIGNRVKVNANGVNVRSDPPELAVLGSVNYGDQGTVIAGPFYGVPKGSSGFYYFWKIDYDTKTDGWTAENFLDKVTSITDQQKQQEILNMVNSHRGLLPTELVLAIIRQEGGEGAFHIDGWNYNSFYRESDAPWAQPTNGDGVMQVTSASGYHEKSGPYTHDQTGYDHAINDGSDYLLENYNTYGSFVQSTLHYNTGPNSLYIYLGRDWGDRNYLSHVATHLSNFVPNIYGIRNQDLADKLNQGQNILNDYLYNKGIATGQSVDYYRTYQIQLDRELYNIGQDNPPTCSIQLRQKDTTNPISQINVNEWFDIYVGSSSDDKGVSEVRFSSDESQDDISQGSWTSWYNWQSSSSDWTGIWDAVRKVKTWLFATKGIKEVWAEIKDGTGQTDKCPVDIYARPQCTSGPCCDTSTGKYKLSGSQPEGYVDDTDGFCEGTNSPTDASYAKTRDYYCNGNDADMHYTDTTVDTCGTCKYCTNNDLTCNYYSSSYSCGTCKTCDGAGSCSSTQADDSDCGTIDCTNWYVQTGTEGATTTEYCYNKQDITSNRCEGFGDCKDSNTADCGVQSNDVLQYSCGICKYISSFSCTGTTLGICSNYPAGTSCGSGKECDGNGNCISVCTDECSSGQIRCNGNIKQTCGNYDADSCLEWPLSTSGAGNEYCPYGCKDEKCISPDIITIYLQKDWNLISLPLELKNMSIYSIFNTTKVVIYGYKNHSFFIPKEIDNKLGYWIKLNQSLNLTLIGAEIENKTISLNKDWNLIGYPYLNEIDVNNSNLKNYTTFAYINSTWSSYISNRTFNSLNIFTPGYGYWVKIK